MSGNTNYHAGKSQDSRRSSSGANSNSSAAMTSLNWRKQPLPALVTTAKVTTSPAGGSFTNDEVAVGSADSKSTSSATSHRKLALTIGGKAALVDGFVVGAEGRADDFYQPPFRRASRSTEDTPSKKEPYRLGGGWRNDGGRGDSPTDEEFPNISMGNLREFDTADGYKTPVRITSANAQQLLPPSACLFVANLNVEVDDVTLELAVQELFRKFGTVYIKIRRDGGKMPYSFCQYTNATHAQIAMREAQGVELHGRDLRIEPARANRTFYLTRTNRNPVSQGEAEAVLAGAGIVGQTWHATPQEKRQYHVKDGIFIQFDMYDAGNILQAQLQRGRVYHLEMIRTVENPHRRADQLAYSRANRARAALDDSEVDRHSIFVGNIPEYFNDENLRALFDHYGPIMGTSIIRNASTVQRDASYVYAFVEFEHSSSTHAAIAAKHGFVIGQYVLKVNKKDTTLKNGRRINRQVMNRNLPRSSPGVLIERHVNQAPTSQPTQPTEVAPEFQNVVYPTPAYSGYIYPPNYQHAPTYPTWNPAPFPGPYAPTYVQAPYQPYAYGTPAPNSFYGYTGEYNVAPPGYYYGPPSAPMENTQVEHLPTLAEVTDENNTPEK